MENHLHVQWKHHQEGVLKFLEELQATETFVDVTLCCEGQKLKAHRVVLSACSPYLQQVLVDNPGEHATIILHDIGAEEMRSLLRFMYSGSASLPRRSLRAFLRAAHALQISVLMPGAERALTEELPFHLEPQSADKTESPQPQARRPPAAPEHMQPHDLSKSSGVKTENAALGYENGPNKRRRHCTTEAPVRSPGASQQSLYQSEDSWGHAFRDGLLSVPGRPGPVPPGRPADVVKSPWSQRMEGGPAPWRPTTVIAPVRPPTPPPSVPRVEPVVCQTSSRDLLSVPGISPDPRKPFFCPSPFCSSPSSTSSVCSSAFSWAPTSPSLASPRTPSLLSVVPGGKSHATPAEGNAPLPPASPDLRVLSPNPAPPTPNPPTPTTQPSPPASPSRFTLKQRRLRDFYRSLQSAGTNTDDSQSGDRQIGHPSAENKAEDSLPVPESPMGSVSPSRPPWPGEPSTPTMEQSVIRLSKKSAFQPSIPFQPPMIVVSPPQSAPETSTGDAGDFNARHAQPQQPLQPSSALPSLAVVPPSSPGGSAQVPSAKSPTGSGGPHACETCGKSFGRRQLLEQHRRTHTGEKPFHCDLCGKSFTQRGHWSVHQRLHDGARPHVCPVCNKAFVSRASLKVHHRTHTGEKPFRCEDCGKQFSQLRNFKYHRSVHEGTREFACTCPECGKQFNDRGYLSSHLKIHRNRKEYACEHCEKRFNQRVAYNMHVRIHTGEKPHACGECGKRFGRKMLLRQHARTHTGERPFRCAQCGKAFADRSNMALHARLHSGEKPHSCDLCGKAFTKKHHLKTHMNFHTGVKPYACEKCGLRFSQSSNMRTHAKKCTAEGGPAAGGSAAATPETAASDSQGSLSASLPPINLERPEHTSAGEQVNGQAESSGQAGAESARQPVMPAVSFSQALMTAVAPRNSPVKSPTPTTSAARDPPLP